jgi:glycosyltransferase involved in cell wall biosynthesis
VRYRVAPERVEVLLTPVDLEAFAPQPRVEACRAAGLAPEMRYALFVGRLDDRVKRVGLLIDVFAGLARGRRDLVLLIAGDGEDRQALEARARAVAPQAVRFLGWCGGATQLAPLYAAAECLVLVSRSEGFPTVIGEAMACGLPVVATDVGGVAEMVENGATGWLLPDGADEHVSAELRRALGEALCGEAQSASMRTRARRAAEDCLASDRIGQRLRQICEGTA